jgi:hypothetical protein
MNKLSVAILFLVACGNTSSDNELVGQVKKVVKRTPILCSDYTEVHLSLGLMRNGVGSMSHEDVELAVDNEDKENVDKLKWAAENGAIVKLSYDVERVSPCWPDHRLIGRVAFEALPDGVAQPGAPQQ